MEIEGEDDSRIIVGNGSKECGRGLGFPSNDRTVSRRHVSFELLTSSRIGNNHEDINPDSEPMISFEVLGKNPIWVFSSNGGDVRTFRRFDRGELRVDDQFCVSANKPILFRMKKIEVKVPEGKEQCVPKAVEWSRRVSEAKGMAETIQNVDGKFEGDESFGFESLNVSDIDPVIEFGFVVMGHEFDRYPKQMVRDINDWEWYLEEPRENIEDDELLERNRTRGKKIGGRKKKRDKRSDDEDWTGESEDEKVLMEKIRKAKRPRHTMARSQDHGEASKDMGSIKHSVQRKTVCSDQGEDEEDEDEDNLGGFIVNDDDLELEEHEEEEEEEEKDYDDDDDDNGNDDDEGNDD
ncbi:transcription initiation factor TFIID subunit 7 [Telopea speciosissima]|uniref:transcription initiation factor TFIID subunit 7 n=1 Tax=Telopea speciosissima TaxID=54955 RepID=UPI001CC70F07|nr:transcription initiation factor TFIID subunit 7 [Telopea speciosissima]